MQEAIGRVVSVTPERRGSDRRSFTKGGDEMIRLIAVAFALTLAGSVQAATPVAPLHQPTSMITQVAYGCGAGRTRVHGVCVARTTKRQVRRCVRWHGSTCARWSY